MCNLLVDIVRLRRTGEFLGRKQTQLHGPRGSKCAWSQRALACFVQVRTEESIPRGPAPTGSHNSDGVPDYVLLSLLYFSSHIVKMADTAAATPAPAAKPAKKASKPKKPTTHPKYSEMIKQALTSLKERGGSSRQAVLKYILANFDVGKDEKVCNAHLKMALRAGVKNDSLKQSKGTGASGSFKLGDDAKKTTNKTAAKKPKAVSVTKKPKAVTKKPATKKPKAKKPKAKSPAKAKKPAAKKPKSPKKAAKPKKAAAKPKKVTKPKTKKPAKKEGKKKEKK